MTASQPFSITVDQVGNGSVRIGDEDVSEGLVGFELVAAAGQVTQLVLHQRPAGGSVSGEGLIRSADVSAADVAAVVRSIPPGEIRKEMDTDLNVDFGSDLVQAARDAIARILSR